MSQSETIFSPEAIDLKKLRQLLSDNFSDSELRELCFDLGIDYENLPPGGKADKARELVALCDRQRRVPELAGLVLARRPHIARHSLIPDSHTGESPFKGLRYFDETDADLFFGRDALTARLVEHLCHHRFLAVVGASGSGKSSLGTRLNRRRSV